MTVGELIQQLQQLQLKGYGNAPVSLRYLDFNLVDRDRDVNFVFMDGDFSEPVAVVSEVENSEEN